MVLLIQEWSILIGFGGGAALCGLLLLWRDRRNRELTAEADRLRIETTRREAENLLREARLEANEEALKLRAEVETALNTRRLEIEQAEERQGKREALINRQLEGLVEQEKSLRTQTQELHQKEAAFEQRHKALEQILDERKKELAQIAHLSQAEARDQLIKEITREAERDAGEISRHIIENAKEEAEDEARKILSVAIQRYASDHTFETTTATVALQGDEIKGRIIGREGRNIRAFEAATGITVLIDDTPNAVVLSGFDPVRREIAREAMQRLILDGRIHPTRIEEVVEKVTQEIDESVEGAGEQAVQQLRLQPMHREIIKILGKLRFRHSFSQNLLDHSIEVGYLTGLIAAELGVDVSTARRTGLLHDIGKALNQDFEGSHAAIGAQFLKQFGEPEDVVNGVAAHHDEVPHTTVLGILVSAADAISASRPGARSESMDTYLKRLSNLEDIALSFEGVDKCFAFQAGRELRVVVDADRIADMDARILARAVARKIEDSLQYPGQIRITVVRETRCVEYAK